MPWLSKTYGQSIKPMYVRLAKDFQFNKPLSYFLPVRILKHHEGYLEALPIENNGSGDFASLTEADGFAELPSDRDHFREGESFKYMPFRGSW